MRRQGMVGAFAMFSEVSGAASVKMGWRSSMVCSAFTCPGGARWGHRVWRAPGQVPCIVVTWSASCGLGSPSAARWESLCNDGVAVITPPTI